MPVRSYGELARLWQVPGRDILMAVKLSKSLKDNQGASGVASTVSEYERRFKIDQRDGSRISDYTTVNDLYYDVVTDFFEFG